MQNINLNDIFGNLVQRFPNVHYHHIESENPEHHWNYLKVDGETVLDLGCGFHLIEDGWLSTPKYFLQKGAKKIIGVDLEYKDIQHFKHEFPDHEFYQDKVDSVSKLNSYINDKNVTSLKMDIEGDEINFISSTSNYPTLKYVAIETHSRGLMHQMVNKLTELNFSINVLCSFYPRVFSVCNLIYASRD